MSQTASGSLIRSLTINQIEDLIACQPGQIPASVCLGSTVALPARDHAQLRIRLKILQSIPNLWLTLNLFQI